MRRARIATIVLVVFVVVAVVVPGLATARARGEPDLSALLVDDDVTPGQDVDLELVLQNSGEVAYATSASEQARVTTARAVQVTLESGSAPIDVQTSTQSIGNVPEGVSSPIAFSISVDEDAETGEYTLPVEVEYTYTSVIGRDGGYNERTRTRTLEVTLVVEDGASFDIVSASADDFFGTSGPVELTIENTGTGTAVDSEVSITSESGQLTFGDSETASTFVGEWPAGETRTVSVEGNLAEGADRRSYPLSATVSYEDADGDDAESEVLRTGVSPRVESRFALQDVESTLAVGEEGAVTGTVVNEGRSTARNAVLVLSADTRNLEPVETEYSLGDLEAGESAEFGFDVEVSESAAGGPRQLDFSVRYRDRNNEVVESDQIDARIDVGPKRDTFAVVPANATLEAGGSGQLRLEVTNQGDEPLSDISAKLFANDPIATSDDEAFIARLDPGESDTIVFGVSAAGTALEKSYPVSLDFQYDDADGDTLLSNTYQVPVQVTEPEDDGGPPILLVVGVLVVVAGVGYYLYRRRQTP